MNCTMREWSKDDMPREKLMANGAASLSNTELLAIILGSGSNGENVMELSRRILAGCGNSLANLEKLSVKQFVNRFCGIGPVKAVSILAALELGRRRMNANMPERPVLSNSRQVYDFIAPHLRGLPHEECWALFLNASNRLIDFRRISIGGVSETLADPRIILKLAIENLATSLVVCHNHPSGSAQPSQSDKQLTHNLMNASKSLGMKLVDHLIVCENSYYSFADQAGM